MSNFTVDLNQGPCVSLTSLSQNLNAASKIDIVWLTTQVLDSSALPRIPGAGKDYVLQVAPDFDAPLDFDA